MLDVTITATRRHEILRVTLESFKKNLFKDYPIKIIINIDPVGPDKDENDCLRVCWDVFPKAEMLFRAPSVPNFSEAFKWVWNESRSNYVFHLEDDWQLMREIDLKDMINMLNRHECLALLRLPQARSTEKTMKNWNLFFPWNGEFFECPEVLKMSAGFCGHPSLIKGEFVQRTAPYIDTTKNPEKQFHHGPKEIIAEVSRWAYGVYSQPNMPSAIQDIGRKWAVQNGWCKQGTKAFFLRWERKEKQ